VKDYDAADVSTLTQWTGRQRFAFMTQPSQVADVLGLQFRRVSLSRGDWVAPRLRKTQ
jgi:hypothetical protein